MQLDHLAVVCARLEDGVAWAEAALGAPMGPGGQHPYYGTHNRLIGLGPDLYFEVVAPDPQAPAPPYPRWFGLDDPGLVRLGNWIVRTDDLEGRPVGAGAIVPLSRGDLAWEITVPEDGSLCEGGAYPSLIRWGPGGHPADRLPDSGLRLRQLQVSHPEPERLAGLLGALKDPRVRFVQGAVALRAEFDTPGGGRWLG